MRWRLYHDVVGDLDCVNISTKTAMPGPKQGLQSQADALCLEASKMRCLCRPPYLAHSWRTA